VEDDRIFINEASAWTCAGLNVAVALIERIWAPVVRSGLRSRHFELLDLAPVAIAFMVLIHARSHLTNPLGDRVGRSRGAIPTPIQRACRAETGQPRDVALQLDCTQDESRVRVNLIGTTIAALPLGCRGAVLKDQLPPIASMLTPTSSGPIGGRSKGATFKTSGPPISEKMTCCMVSSL
jgi:hypothetical protein